MPEFKLSFIQVDGLIEALTRARSLEYSEGGESVVIGWYENTGYPTGPPTINNLTVTPILTDRKISELSKEEQSENRTY